jgi:hypothetical protein
MEYKIPHKKAEVTPKVTSTKISISKSTPFFIRRHHLDDTQMYVSSYSGKIVCSTIGPSDKTSGPTATQEKYSNASIVVKKKQGWIKDGISPKITTMTTMNRITTPN